MRPGVFGILAVTVTVAAVPASTSCSDDPPAEGPAVDAGPDAPPPLEPDASSFVNDFCAIHEPCCAPLTGAGTKCITETGRFGRGKAFDAAKAKTCLSGLRAEAKGLKFCGQGPDMITCAAVFKSAEPKPPGQPCKASSECANAADADGLCVGSGDTAKCRQVKRGKEGEACIGTRAAGKTDEPATLPDTASALCFVADGLQCDPSTTKCAKRGAVGASCTPSDGACVDAAWCNPGTKQCMARTAKGAKCKAANECVAGHECSNDGAGGGACIALMGEGGACIRGDECDPGASLVCDTNTTRCIADTTVYEHTCSGGAALGTE